MTAISTPVRHEDATVQAHIDAYVAATGRGESMLVRPLETFDGLERVAAAVAAASPAPLLVTDLAATSRTRTDVGGGGLSDSDSDSEPSDEPLLAYPTSGSTGSPKCVVYRRSAVLEHARTVADVLGLTTDNTYVALPPIRFAYGLSILNSHLYADVPVTFCGTQWGLPGLAAALTAGDGPVALYLLPQHVPLVLAANLDPHRLVRVFVAGGRISGPSVAALAQRFPRMRLMNMYGQAEMGPRLATWDGDPADFVEGTIGRPLPGVDLRVEAHDGRPGPLWARSDYAMWACLRAPYTRIEPGPGAEQIRTGDLAVCTTGGLLRHEGRADHILNVAGTKVDARALTRLVQDAFAPLVVRLDQRPSAVAGDVVPVIEVVPGAGPPPTRGAIRRALSVEFGSLATLFDVRIVDRLTVKESGK